MAAKDAAKKNSPPQAGGKKARKPEAEAKAKAKTKKTKEAEAEAKPEAPAKAEPPPRKPADPRLKVLKKFHGKFLPKGPLRERHKALMARWDSGEDHGGVTAEELKSLLDDWRKSREKPARRQAPV